jgi:hypothetical protein
VHNSVWNISARLQRCSAYISSLRLPWSSIASTKILVSYSWSKPVASILIIVLLGSLEFLNRSRSHSRTTNDRQIHGSLPSCSPSYSSRHTGGHHSRRRFTGGKSLNIHYTIGLAFFCLILADRCPLCPSVLGRSPTTRLETAEESTYPIMSNPFLISL